jgi:hypothetical protein
MTKNRTKIRSLYMFLTAVIVATIFTSIVSASNQKVFAAEKEDNDDYYGASDAYSETLDYESIEDCTEDIIVNSIMMARWLDLFAEQGYTAGQIMNVTIVKQLEDGTLVLRPKNEYVVIRHRFSESFRSDPSRDTLFFAQNYGGYITMATRGGQLYMHEGIMPQVLDPSERFGDTITGIDGNRYLRIRIQSYREIQDFTNFHTEAFVGNTGHALAQDIPLEYLIANQIRVIVTYRRTFDGNSLHITDLSIDPRDVFNLSMGSDSDYNHVIRVYGNGERVEHLRFPTSQ